MALENKRNSNAQLLDELEELSQSLYQNHTATNRRTASLVLPRTSIPAITPDEDPAPILPIKGNVKLASRARWMSLSPRRSRPKLDDTSNKGETSSRQGAVGGTNSSKHEEPWLLLSLADQSDKKGIWKWKPIRALAHIRMQKLSCLFSVEVVAAQGLPSSMNGLRLSVCVRKKESKDGAVHTMPSRVSQGAVDFEEMLFLRCHVFCTPGSSGGKSQQQPLKFEPRPFLIYLFAVDAEELDFGRSSVDLSRLIQESIAKSGEGARVRQWDTSFTLSGKAKGGELVVKLGFQIMEDGGVDIYSQTEVFKSGKKSNFLSSSARRQSKTSFSVPSPRIASRAEAWTPSMAKASGDFQGIEHLDLDEPAVPSASSPSSTQKPANEEPETKGEDLDIPDFEIVDKGVEIQDKAQEEEGSEESVEYKSTSSEVVKEVVHDPVHLTRLMELDSIAQQIKALESMMGEDRNDKATEDETDSQRLDADEETVTKEFLQMLEDEDADSTFKFNQPEVPFLHLDGGDDTTTEAGSEGYVSNLGKGLGCVVQTRNGGYLAALNPLNTHVARKDTPKLAMQLSRPLVIPLRDSISGFEVFQKMAADGFEGLSSQILSLMPMDELMGKTAEQVAFEGIASAIIQARNKEGASSSAARTIAAVKAMSTAMSRGRKDRILTGIWNVSDNPLPAEELLAFSLQKVEAMAVEALKIQAELSEEDAPFDVSPLSGKLGAEKEQTHPPLASAVPLEDWIKSNEEPRKMGIMVVIQLRDPVRRYEAVGGPLVALVNASPVDNEERVFRVTSLHVCGLKVRSGEKRNTWDTERQRLTAIQWLIGYGLGKKGKHLYAKGQQDTLWSISSRIMADMWLKPIRNPDVKFAKHCGTLTSANTPAPKKFLSCKIWEVQLKVDSALLLIPLTGPA